MATRRWPVSPASVGQQALSNFSLGRVNGDLGFGGLVLSASSESVSVLVRALASQRTLHVLSRPQIRTVDNQLAQIQVGQQVPIVSSVSSNSVGNLIPNLTPQQVGIILQVTPRITPDDFRAAFTGAEGRRAIVLLGEWVVKNDCVCLFIPTNCNTV